LFVTAAKTSAVVMFLVAAAMVSAWLITVANLPAQDGRPCWNPCWTARKLLMFAIMVLAMVVGTALDMTPTILLLTPVLMPVVKAAGIDPVYFGVLFIINNAIGLITPPVGTVLNAVAGVGKVSMDEVTQRRGAVHDCPVRHHVSDGAVPAVGDGAGPLVLLTRIPSLCVMGTPRTGFLFTAYACFHPTNCPGDNS